MPPAARTGDSTAHGGVLGPPPPAVAARVATVLIGGKPAAVVGSTHVCVIPPHAALGPANVVMPGPPRPSGVVLIGGLVAACVGDRTTCGANIVLGAPNVLIGGPL
jgi:uncharacterized Zn-binding protein involved in type VI secretion